MTSKISHIPLEGLLNLRDLGGLPTRNGQVTAFHRYLRSEWPETASAEALAYFEKLPLKLVIDLRRPEEVQVRPCALEGRGAWRYSNISIMEVIDHETLWKNIDEAGCDYPMAQVYCASLRDPHPNSARLLHELASVNDGAVLFHCAHGKDRTGLVAALLLLGAGVLDADIVANYSISQDYMHPILAPLNAVAEARNRPFNGSDAENMRRYLNEFYHLYGTLENYGQAVGASAEAVQKLQRRLLEA